MAIEVECEACFHLFRVGDQNAGKRGKCPECGATIRVPGGPVASSPAPRTAKAAAAPGRSAAGRSSKRRSKKSSGSPKGVMVGVGAGGAALLGIFVVLHMLRPDQNAPDAAPVAETAAASPSAEAAPITPSPDVGAVHATAATAPLQTTAAKLPSGSPVRAAAPPATDDSASQPASGVATLARAGQPLSTAELVKRVEPSIVRINALDEMDELEWHGSGFVVDASGVIATNHHVVAGAHKCVAEFASGSKFEVKGFYVMDERRDIALVQLDLPPGEYQALPLASSPPDKGEQVLAFGCPYGLDFSTTDGLVSAFRSAADIKSMLGAEVEGEWLQTSAPVSPGNSGGPLVNMRGEVVGINSLVRTEGQNLNFAISAADVRSMFDSRGTNLTALSRGTQTKDGQIDLLGSRAARQFLSKVDTVFLMIKRSGEESNSEMISTVESYAKKHLRAADVGTTGLRTVIAPLMYIVIEAQDGVEQGTADVAIVAQLLYPVIEGEDVQILIVWEKREELGSPKKFKLRRDPKGELQEGLSRFFEAMEHEFKAAKKSTE